MKKPFLNLLVFLALFTSCSTAIKKPAELTLLQHPALGTDSMLFLSEILEEVQVVPLSNVNAPLLGMVDKVIAKNNRFYIFSQQMQQPIAVFDADGNFKHSVGQIGGGPFEFARVGDFDVDESNGNVYMLDMFKNKIIQFDEDGRAVKEHKMDFKGTHLVVQDEYLYVESSSGHDSTGHSILILDKNFKKVNSFYPSELRNLNHSGRTPMTPRANSSDLLLVKHENDTIYSLNKSGYTPLYWVDFGVHKIKPEDKAFLDQPQDEDVMRNHKYLKEKNLTNGLIFAAESDRYVMGSFSLATIVKWLIYDKKTQTLLSPEKIVDDISYLSSWFPRQINNNQLVEVYYPQYLEGTIFQMTQMIDNRHYKNQVEAIKKRDELKAYMEKTDMTQSNPMLKIYTLKK
jgi:hypothetical protein